MEKPPIVSEEPLTVVFKNFMRNRMVNLSAISVKHFLPNAKFYCATFYKQSMDEYADQEQLNDDIIEFTAQTKWDSGKNVHDHEIQGHTSGFGHPLNGCFFTEGYNVIQEFFKDTEEHILMLAEDHYFTTGATLREVMLKDWDVLWIGWDGDNVNAANASMLGVRPKTLASFFPMPEHPGMVELIIGSEFVKPIRQAGLRDRQVTTRNGVDYMGDGEWVNSSVHIQRHLEQVGIL